MKFSLFKVFVCSFILLTYGCKKDDICKNSDIVGSWLITEGCILDTAGEIIECEPVTYVSCENMPSDSDYYIFKSDGTYVNNFGNCDGAGVYTCTSYFEGTWTLSETSLTFTETQSYDCFSDEFTDSNELSLFVIVSCGDGKLVVKDESDPSEILQITFTQQ